MTRVLADVGQTGLRVAWQGGRASLPVSAVPLATPGAVSRLTAQVVEACVTAGCEHPGLLLLGVSGWHDRATAQELVDRLREALGGATIIAAPDDVTAYLGALGPTTGAVLLAGTGVVALSSRDGTSRRVGGHGWAIDDEGGGFWVGRQGLLHAVRAFEGRGPETDLLPRAVARFGAVEQWAGRIQQGAGPVGIVASFAPEVAQAADAGDAVALDIWDRAAAHLAEVLYAACEGFPERHPPAVAVTGGLCAAGDVLMGPLPPERHPPAVAVTGGLCAAGDVLMGPLTRRLSPLGLTPRHVAHGTPLDGADLLDEARSLSLFADQIVTTELT